jgi:hypothetical protein
LPGDFPTWTAVYPLLQRWLKAGCFEAIQGGQQLAIRGTLDVRGRAMWKRSAGLVETGLA